MPIEKEQILSELRRVAAKNGGEPPGIKTFRAETGIKLTDWQGRHWAKWSDALVEAGFTPNQKTQRIPDVDLLEPLLKLAAELGRFPTSSEMRLRSSNSRDFPVYKTYQDRFTNIVGMASALMALCLDRADHAGAQLCQDRLSSEMAREQPDESQKGPLSGQVYLAKSGRFYKIGRTASTGRRGYELAIQLPEKLTIVHEISTDDPVGIEAYWHIRFRDNRKNGEWFELSSTDVAAFKRRKFM